MAEKQKPNKGNKSNEDMLRIAEAVRRLCIPFSELKRKYEHKKRG
ncbi:hypothetical protein ACTOJ1_000023 [Shigella flexneri]